MSLEKIETELKKITQNLIKETFIFDFLLAYNQPKATINRLKKGDYNLSKNNNELIWKKKIFYHETSKEEDVHDVIDEISKSEEIKKNNIRFIIVTDFKIFLSIDVKTGETLDIQISELAKNSIFFLPLTGREKFKFEKENPADIKAANELGKLYDQILKDNENLDLEIHRKDLNIFFSRLLFLYYADDSEIFEKNLFLKTISELTEKDGKNVDDFFHKLFQALNTDNKTDMFSQFKKFPYVNGNLFNKKIKLPKFTSKSREIIIKNASLDWQNINPDILGSMLQSVVSSEERSEDEMHYTSVPNILKVINPLFLDDLNRKFEDAEEDENKLKKILKYIYNIKIFDPACGSGNFLIISYFQLCLLEIKIFKILNTQYPENWRLSMPGISLSQFYGIEKSHFATETVKLSLWIAEHQMNIKLKDVFEKIKPSLPLSQNDKIINANSADINWEEFCKKVKTTSSIFLVGNPPYKGFSSQSINQKQDMEKSLKVLKGYRRLDYITLWIYKATQFISYNKISSCGFVSTNSLCQGQHIDLFWPQILDEVEISFAVKSFPWGNNAKNNAVVSCIIIGLSLKNSKEKTIVDGNLIEKCKKISPYLTSVETIGVRKRDTPFCSDFPRMIGGNMDYDSGFLKLNNQEYHKIIEDYPKSKAFIRKLTGGSEFINGHKRWVLWIEDNNLNDALKIKEIKERIKKVKEFREKAGSVARGLAKRSHQFRFRNVAKKNFILIPYTSTKDRFCLPIGIIEKDYIVLASAKVIFDPPTYIFGILSSRTHFLWVLNTSGKMKNDIRYSSSLCYNTFPMPKMADTIKQNIENISLQIIDEREKYSDLPISKLYGKEMPIGLINLHKINDEIIDEYIFGKQISNEDEKVKILFKKYNELINEEKLL